jgi:hypothetical protein
MTLAALRGAIPRAAVIVALCALAGGCAQTGPLLTRVVTEEPGEDGAYREVPGEAIPSGLSITRNGRALVAQVPMELAPGDEVDAGANTTAVIHFPQGHEVYVLPHSRVRIGSIFAYFGELIVRAKGIFSVETEYVTAGVEGTEFWVKLEKDQDAEVGVVEGRVRLASKADQWPAVLVKENEAYSLHADGPPRFEKERMAAEFRRKLRTIQALTRLPKPPRLKPK